MLYFVLNRPDSAEPLQVIRSMQQQAARVGSMRELLERTGTSAYKVLEPNQLGSAEISWKDAIVTDTELPYHPHRGTPVVRMTDDGYAIRKSGHGWNLAVPRQPK